MPSAHGSERDRLDRLLATARRVAESLDLDTVLTSIVTDATALLGADSGDMLLWDRERDVLRVVAVANFPPEMVGFELAFGEGLSSQAILGAADDPGGPLRDVRASRDGARALRVRGRPLCPADRPGHRDRRHQRARPRRPARDSPTDGADLLAAFAGHAAIAIDHARRYENEVRLGRDLAAMNRDLTRSLVVQQRLAEAVLSDAGTGRDRRGPCRSTSTDGSSSRITCTGRSPGRRPTAARTGADSWMPRRTGRPPIATAVRVGPDVVGHLLLSSDADLGPTDRALVDVATTGVALEFAKERAAAEVEERLRGEAATDLLTGAFAQRGDDRGADRPPRVRPG